jgi:radical SAM protein with 4Fe4S-binding SPASM domain
MALVDFYSDNPDITRTTLLPVLWKRLPIEDPAERWNSGICGMGRNMTTIGIDGRIYPCSRIVTAFRRGAGEGVEISRTTLGPECCAACVLLPMCPDCRAFNYESYGDTNHKTRFHCEFVQLQLRAAALLTIRDVVRIREQRAPQALNEDERLFLAQRLETALFIEDYTRGLQQSLHAGL